MKERKPEAKTVLCLQTTLLIPATLMVSPSALALPTTLLVPVTLMSPPRPLETTDSGADIVNTDEAVEPNEPTTGHIDEAPEPPELKHEDNTPPSVNEYPAFGNANNSSSTSNKVHLAIKINSMPLARDDDVSDVKSEPDIKDEPEDENEPHSSTNSSRDPILKIR
ncbi:hypothetical protein FPANT_8177 [Fusarium pseudoanthophilum]|uniref:Uncharacterized protein n=1 Tax=Fusarium pseudoanthophilum TaxID=48495 RepID=A0A8H5L237_9HYPO|nr:hypothetical protein FPANT_8177 [Fusarium pseudoanthophilum]